MRSVTLKLQLSLEQWSLFRRAASLLGIGIADFVRKAACAEAQDIIWRRYRIRAIRGKRVRMVRPTGPVQGTRRIASGMARRRRLDRMMGSECSGAAARLMASAWKQIIEGADWLPMDALGEDARAWLRERRTFCLHIGGVDCIPAYTLDGQRRPLPVISAILKMLDWESGERIAAWFESTSACLGGQRPRELIREAPSQVVAAAHDQRVAEDL